MKKVTIGLLGFSERAASILTLFLSRRLKDTCALVEGRGQLNILDLDCVNAKELWRNHSNLQDVMPSIVVSVHKKDLPNTIWLQKPLDVKRLSKVIDTVITDYQLQQLKTDAKHVHEQTRRHATTEHTTRLVPEALEIKEKPSSKVDLSGQRLYVSNSLKGFSKTYSSNDLEQAVSDLNVEHRSLRWFYGSREDDAYTANFNSPELYYDPEQYLQGAYSKARKWARNKNISTQIIGAGVHLFITDTGRTTYSNKNLSSLKQVCFVRTTGKVFNVEPLINANSFERQKKQLVPFYSNNLLWSLSLWSARGRLPVGISGDTVVSLTRWPNFTRIDISTHAMIIVALWFNKPATINATAVQLNVPFRAVYSVFSACYALGLVKQLSNNELKQQQSVKKISLPKQFFRSLFKKLN